MIEAPGRHRLNADDCSEATVRSRAASSVNEMHLVSEGAWK